MQKQKRKSTLAEQEISLKINDKRFDLKLSEIQTPVGKAQQEDIYVEVAGSKSKTGETNLIARCKKELPAKFCEAVGFKKLKRHGQSFFSAKYYILDNKLYPLGNDQERMESLIQRIKAFEAKNSHQQSS